MRAQSWVVLSLLVLGIGFSVGYWFPKNLASIKTTREKIAYHLQQKSNIEHETTINTPGPKRQDNLEEVKNRKNDNEAETTDWAREVIRRADRLVTYGGIAIALVGAVFAGLGIFFAVGGARWIHQHSELVKTHKKTEKMFRESKEVASSMTEQLALPLFEIDIMDLEKRQMIEERLKGMEGKTRPIEEIDQMVSSLELFSVVELNPDIFIQLGHYYRYRARAINQSLEKKRRRGLEKEEEEELISQMRKEFFKALDRYKTAANKKEDFAAAYYNMGIIHLALKKWQDALHCFDKAIQINTNRHKLYFEPYYGRGVALDELNRFKEAIETYRIAYQLKRDYPLITYNIGCSYTRWGEHAEEVREEKWRKAIMELGKIFHIDKIRQEARTDPELECLRRDEGYKDLFSPLIEWREDN